MASNFYAIVFFDFARLFGAANMRGYPDGSGNLPKQRLIFGVGAEVASADMQGTLQPFGLRFALCSQCCLNRPNI